MASTLPFAVVNVNENEVPGALFIHDEIEKHSVVQLKRWLQCRGLSSNGKKEDLVERCKKVVEQGGSTINASIDKGKWLNAKANICRRRILQDQTQLPRPPQFPIHRWKRFPGNNIPKNFDYGKIYEYLVESASIIYDSRNESEDKNASDSGNEIDGHTSKPLKKANIMSSYQPELTYHGLVMIDSEGKISDASCECKASAMGRCNHIAAILFALEDYVNIFGYEPTSCTSKLCEWNKGRRSKRNPTEAAQSDYKKKKKDLRKQFEPRPKELISDTADNGRVNRFLCELQTSSVKENFKFPTMWEQVLEFIYEDYSLDAVDMDILVEKVNSFIENLAIDGCSETKPYMVPGTDDQSASDLWKYLRCVLVTASRCREVFTNMERTGSNLKPMFNLVKGILWSEKNIQTRAMAYGIKNESLARKAYEEYLNDNSTEKVTVEPTGLWQNPNYVGLACSPDGLVKTVVSKVVLGLVEIKCPKILEEFAPDALDKLKPNQKSSFCCKKINGVLKLKTSHKYYMQVQMQMAVTALKWCDFVVWTPKGISVERIYFDENEWAAKVPQLITFHRAILIPEYLKKEFLGN